MPASTVIPVLAYPSVAEAVAWLSAAFGFTLRLGIGDHRAQLNAGDGAIVVIGGARAGRDARGRDSIMVRVDDARRPLRAGASRRHDLDADRLPYGERQYTALDSAATPGRSETLRRVDPRDWAATWRCSGAWLSAQVFDADDRRGLRARRGSVRRGRAGGRLGAGLAVIAGDRRRRAARAGGRTAARRDEAPDDHGGRGQRDERDDDGLPVEASSPRLS